MKPRFFLLDAKRNVIHAFYVKATADLYANLYGFVIVSISDR
jgi:hypothetical protein